LQRAAAIWRRMSIRSVSTRCQESGVPWPPCSRQSYIEVSQRLLQRQPLRRHHLLCAKPARSHHACQLLL